MRISTYYDCLWDGSQQLRLDDLPKLVDTGFNCFATQLTPDALDPTKLDGKFLDACKAAKVQVIVERNTLTLAQYQQLVQKYPGTVVGLNVVDDANSQKPADVAKAIADAQPFLSGTTPFITVGKGAAHGTYAPLIGPGGYTVQNYISPKILDGGGLKAVAYDAMLAAKAVAQGAVYSIAYLGRNTTPYFGRNDPVWRAEEYSDPSFNEAVMWLGLIAGCDSPYFYTAYAIDRDHPREYSRIAERWDLLPAYKLMFAKVQRAAEVMQSPGVQKVAQTAPNGVACTWTKPDGSGVRVTVDLTEERSPQTRVDPFQPPTMTNVRITSTGAAKVEVLP